MEDTCPRAARRIAGIVTGLAVHLLFAVTVVELFGFLRGRAPRPDGGGMLVNALLALQFSVVHSALLLPRARRRLERYIAPAFYGLFYCAVTCATLLVTIFCWHTGAWSAWRLEGWPRTFVQIAFLASWVALVYSLNLNGLGYQTGWTPWWHWVRGKPLPRREFKPRGAYLFLRHPVYLSFLGLVWFTPDMTADRVVLTAVWTVYIFFGSWLKDRRLTHYLGDRYREYQGRVPGYPGVFFGPLARARPSGAARPEEPAIALNRGPGAGSLAPPARDRTLDLRRSA